MNGRTGRQRKGRGVGGVILKYVWPTCPDHFLLCADRNVDSKTPYVTVSTAGRSADLRMT